MIPSSRPVRHDRDRRSPFMRKVAVVKVNGLLASGKTRFGRLLTECLNAIGLKTVFVEEPTALWRPRGHPELYYSDIAKYALEFQTLVLETRYQAFVQRVRENPDAEVFILDRSIEGDRLFAENLRDMGLMRPDEWEKYLVSWEKHRRRFESWTSVSVPLFLNTCPEVSMVRKEERNRPGEDKVTIDYQRAIYERHVRDLPGYLSTASFAIRGDDLFETKQDIESLIQDEFFPHLADVLPGRCLDAETMRRESPALYLGWKRRSSDGLNAPECSIPVTA